MDDFQRERLGRLPLGQAARLLLSHVPSEPFPDDVSDAHRGRCDQANATRPR